MITLRTTILSFLTLTMLFSSVFSLPAMAQDDQDHKIFLPALFGEGTTAVDDRDAIEVADVSLEEEVAAEEFWTREMLLSAEPIDLLSASEEQVLAAEEAIDQMPQGLMGSAPGGLPDNDATVVAQTLYSDEWNNLAETAVDEIVMVQDQEQEQEELFGYSSSPPFTSYYVNNYTNTWQGFPWRATGRLFFQIPGSTGTNSCTASVAYGRAVWTAGHCVFTRGRGWHTNMVFVPAYRNGYAPYGSFTVFSRNSLLGWTRDNNLAYDIGMVAVRDRSSRKVSQWVGYLGYIYNAPATQMFHSFGYPVNLGNNGRYLIACAGATYTRDSRPGPDPIGIGCDMTNGSSGGPWIIAYAPFRSGAVNYVNGVNSYGIQSRPNIMYSPYFGDGARALYDWGRLR